MDNNTCLNIIAGFVIAVCFCGLLYCVSYLVGRAYDLKWKKRQEEAEYQCYLQRMKDEEEAKRREKEKENWDNIRPRWEEQAKYLKEQEYQKIYHQQVSFINWEEDATEHDENE